MRIGLIFFGLVALVAARHVPGYTFMESLGNAAIDPPLDCNGDGTYFGSHVFTDGDFDVGKCAALCTANLKHCKFFNTYILYKNHHPQGQYCTMYTQAWDSSYLRQNGKEQYGIGWSYTFRNATDAGYPICPADIAYLEDCGQEFCTSFISHTPVSTVTTTIYTGATTTTDVRTTTETSTTTVVQTSTTTTSAFYTTIESAVSTQSSITTISTTTTPGTVTTTVEIETTATSTSTTYTTAFVPVFIPRKRAETASAQADATTSQSMPAVTGYAAASPTPALITRWPSSKISEACSQVAKGTSTSTLTIMIPTFATTVFSTITTTSVITAFASSTTTITSPTYYTTISYTSKTTQLSTQTDTITAPPPRTTVFTTSTATTVTTTTAIAATTILTGTLPGKLSIAGLPGAGNANVYVTTDRGAYFVSTFNQSEAPTFDIDSDGLLFTDQGFSAQEGFDDLEPPFLARRDRIGPGAYAGVLGAAQPDGTVRLRNNRTGASVVQARDGETYVLLGSTLGEGYTAVQLYVAPN